MAKGDENMRLDKFLAESAIGTRKNVRNYIKDGSVKVNGQVITEPAKDIDENNDCIEYLGKMVKHKGKVYYMFHKPGGCITARKDEINKTVFDYFDKDSMEGVFHIGRLDKDTEGLLLFTNDGEYEHKLMSPKKHIDKTYFFWALGNISDEEKYLLENGISISEKEPLTKPANLKIHKSGIYKDFQHEKSINKFYSMNTHRYDQQVTAGYLTISEGRKHQVKRMLKAVGCYVIYLKRVSIGELMLDVSLEEGQYRKMTEEEINMSLNL